MKAKTPLIAQVMVGGSVVGVLERNKPRNLTLGAPSGAGEHLTLDIIVHAMGRINFGCVWDYKGLVNPDIKLDGALVLTARHGGPTFMHRYAHHHGFHSKFTLSSGQRFTG